jgi:hypothetical protein
MSDAQALEQHHFLPWLIVIVPMMVMASTVMSLAGS